MAAPKVAGVVAMLHQAGITDSAAVKALLINSSDQVGWKADRGWGLINLERARAANTLFRGEVSPAGHVLLRGRNTGNLYATLAWKRHGSMNGGFAFHDLDLFVYDANGNQLASSETGKQNVEQVAVETAGEVVVKVKAFNNSFGGGIAREKFAVALSQSGFAPVTGPVLAAACTADSNTVARGTAFVLTCALANRGDLAGQDAKVSINLTGVDAESVGVLAAGQRVERRYRVAAPGTPGTYTIQFGGSAVAAAETVTARTSFLLTVR